MNLFLRTFVAFVVAGILASGGFLLISSAFQSTPLIVSWQRIEGVLRLCALEAPTHRPEEFSAFLARASQATELRLHLYGSESSAPLVQATRTKNEIVTNFFQMRAAVPVQFATGERRVVVAEVAGETWQRRLQPTVRIALSVLLAALVCYGLARSVSTPILLLRGAAHQVALGDLEVRLSEKPLFRRRHDELGELARDFDRMVAQLHRGRDSQRQLLADISHELRSPLARLSVALELARRKVGPEALGSIDRIEREAERMNLLIAELLNLTRLEASVLPLEARDIDLLRLVHEVVEDADFEAGARGCRVVVETTEVALIVEGVEELLCRAVENIVRNAIRYTDEGTTVSVTLEQQERSVQLCIRDHGPGVPEDVLEQLFVPFWRVGTDRDRASGGVGLGLAIAERAVRLHGGHIRAENAADGGLSITITLPKGSRE